MTDDRSWAEPLRRVHIFANLTEAEADRLLARAERRRRSVTERPGRNAIATTRIHGKARVIQALVGCWFLAAPSNAQGAGRVLMPPGHLGIGVGIHAPFESAEVGEPFGWSLVVDDDGKLETLRILETDFRSGSLATSVTVPRDYCVLPDWSVMSPHIVVLAGADALGQGVVEVVQVDPLAMAPVSLAVATYRGFDFLGVAFDPYSQRLALLDAADQVVMDAPWVPGAALPSAASFTTWDMSNMPAELFSGLSEKNLTFVGPGRGSPPSIGLFFVGAERDPFSTGHFLVPGVGATAYAGTWFDQPGGYEPFARSDDELATTMLVQGNPGSTVEVVRLETGVVIGQTSIPVAGWQFDQSYPCPLGEPLRIGDTYVVRYAGSSTDGKSTRVLCVARHGFPGESVPSGLTLGSVAPPRGAYLGNTEFDVSVPLSGGVQTTTGYYTGAMAFLALRSPGGVDPLQPNPWGGNLLVTPVFSGFVPAFIFPNGCGELRWVYSVANDPALVGEVVLTQFLITEPDPGPQGLRVAVSEAVGVLLHRKAP